MMAPAPAESQKVVPLMSMTRVAGRRLAADSSAWRIWPALPASISIGIAITARWPTHWAL